MMAQPGRSLRGRAAGGADRPRRHTIRQMRARTVALVALAALLAALALAPAARAWATTALLLPDLLDLSVRPLALVAGAPTREEVRLPGASADIYRPSGGGRHGGLVMTLGVHPLDKRDPVVVRLGQSLARAGLAVMIVQSDELMADPIGPGAGDHLAAPVGLVMTLGVHPLDKRDPVVVRLGQSLARAGLAVMIVQSDELMADRIGPEAVDTLVAAFERLAAEPGVAPDRVGLFGFSAGASL